MTKRKPLSYLVKEIENSCGVKIKLFPYVFPFGSNSLFEVCAYFERQGPYLWNGIDRYTGDVESNISFLVENMEHMDEIVYALSSDRHFIVIASVEESIGVQLADSPNSRLPLKRSISEDLKDFQSSLRWNLRMSKYDEYNRYLLDWNEFAGGPPLTEGLR